MSILDAASWKQLDGSTVRNIRTQLKRCSSKKYTLHIGTDTNPHAQETTLITTICFREPGKGVIVFYQKRSLPTFKSVLDRLIHEAVVSLEVAGEVKSLTDMVPTIHADVSPHNNTLSNRVTDAIMGMIKGMGYPVLIKPEAWAADIADMYTR